MTSPAPLLTWSYLLVDLLVLRVIRCLSGDFLSAEGRGLRLSLLGIYISVPHANCHGFGFKVLVSKQLLTLIARQQCLIINIMLVPNSSPRRPTLLSG